MSLGMKMNQVARLFSSPVATSGRAHARARLHVSAAVATNSGDSFKPMDEVEKELSVVRRARNSADLVQVGLHDEIVAAINDQINIEYSISYVYHAIHCYFDRDIVSMPGLAEHFLQESLSERAHAQKLIKYLNKRGGKVALKAIMPPETEYDDEEKGDALNAMELALSLEKLNYSKCVQMAEVAEKYNDANFCNFVDDFLDIQVEEIREYSAMVAQLRRVGKGLGEFQWDLELLKKYE
eukprot:jgi/Ulvmu1/1998/UM012_0161.1